MCGSQTEEIIRKKGRVSKRPFHFEIFLKRKFSEDPIGYCRLARDRFCHVLAGRSCDSLWPPFSPAKGGNGRRTEPLCLPAPPSPPHDSPATPGWIWREPEPAKLEAKSKMVGVLEETR